MSSLGYVAYKLAVQVSPIVLTNGIAENIPGGMLPIIALTEAVNFTLGLLEGADDINLDDFFATFMPMPGAGMISQELGRYPFANQQTAANAVIPQPLTVSYKMDCPVRKPAGYPAKLATMLLLQSTLRQHNLSGGTYTCITPSLFYTNCVMRDFRAIGDVGKQLQTTWQIDFEQPLLTQDQANQAQQQLNGLMSKISNGTEVSAPISYSGLSPSVGIPPSIAAPGVVPSASNLPGASIAGGLPVPGL